jgi:nitrite reductase/ring-hydroxylating ferredoxin subunit
MRPLDDLSHESPRASDVTSAAPSDGGIDRRRFLKQMEVLAGGVMMCGALPLLASGCAARARYLTPTIVGDRLGVPVASADVAGGLLVEDPRSDLPIYLRRTSPGAYTAVSTKCGHRGCQVEPAADKMACPCHGSEYTFTGEILQGPTERPLTRFRVTSDAAMVYIHLASYGAP